MPWPQQFRKLFLLASYLALSSVPLLPLLDGQPVPQLGQLLGAECLLWATIWALFGRPANFHWLLLPAFLALPLELYLRLFFGEGLTAHHLGILAETTSGEALEFMGGKVWFMLFILLAVAAWWVLCFVAARHTEGLAWRGPTRWAYLTLLGSLAGVSAYGYEFGVANGGRGAHALGIAGMPALPPLANIAEDVKFAGTRPFGLVAVAADFIDERNKIAMLTAGTEHFKFQARQQQPDGAAETVVVVLGESSRFDRWRLNGYARDTNPELSKERNLILLSDMASPVSTTRQSVPVIVTRKPASLALTPGFNELSFVSAYKEAGFKTWWLSNQLTYGAHDTPIAAYSREADQVLHLNQGGHTEQSSYDEALLAPLQQALSAPEPRKLVVLHTLGNHWNYARRYPPQFNHWQPSLTGINRPQLGDPALLLETNNSYDNSIRYTDWFLAQVIAQLKQSGQRAVLIYVSDHGEVLRDAQCPLYLHGHHTEAEHHVPGLIWFADQYRARYPDKVAALDSNRNARLGTPDMFHTVLDLGDIRYPGEKLEWSFAQAGYTPRERLVASVSWADYDTAERTGACRSLDEAPARHRK